MQLTAIFLTACCLTVSAGTLSQSNITYSGKEVKLEIVFQAVKNQTGYYFIYNKEAISKANAVTVNAKNIPLAEFMDMVLKDQNLEWVLQKTTILIQQKKQGQQENKIEEKPDPVTGIVRESEGQPIQGANIMIKGTKRGTTTDNEGRFKISADEGNILEISAIGFGKKEIKISGQQQIIVSLEVASSVLDEVQYIAYGQTTKRYSVSNSVTIKAGEIEKQPVQNPLLTLQARVPGLVVTQSSGLAGTPLRVRIQGQNSIKNGNDPLYVVDGVPIDAQLQSTGIDHVLAPNSANESFVGTGNGNPLNYLNPSDIESIDVLKDADATAIYGSRAANGAILITTKRGKAGPMRFDLNMQEGIGRVARRMEMMNIRQYLDMRYEAFRNDNIDWRSPSVSANDLKVWDTTRNNDWQKELLGGNARYTNISATLSGGNNNLRYLVSATYHKETTVFPFPDFDDQKAAVHFNLNANNSSQKLRMQFSGNFMVDDNKLPQRDLTQVAMLMSPNAPQLLNADGSINWAPDASGNTTLGASDVNVMIQKLRKYENKTYNLLSSLKIDYALLPGLNIGSAFGYNYMQTNDYSPWPLIAVAPELRGGTQRSASFGDRNSQAWIIEPQANYRTKISKGTIDIMIGSTFQEKNSEATYITGRGQLSDDLLDNVNSAATIVKGAGSSYSYRYNALFARANYNWSDKYIINVNARRDGSSRFGADNHFHNFGSIGAAWIFSAEPFFERYASHISFGKLRGSYGTTGSDQIGDYKYLSLYRLNDAAVPYQGVVGLFPDDLPNPLLQWEETRKLQLGIDLGFLHERLIVNTTFARNRSSNQLLAYPLPLQTGFGDYQVNLPATIQNTNWEFLVIGKIIEKNNWTWTSSINLTLPKNKLIEFANLSETGYTTSLHVGKPIDVVAYFHYLGVAPGTGDYLFADNKGNPTLTPNAINDRTVLISQFPKWYGGLDNTITYKNFSCSFIFQFVRQTGYNDIEFSNGSLFYFPGMFKPGYTNQPAIVLDRWQNAGDNNKPVARYRTIALPYIMESDRRFKDTWYMRLKNIAVSWDVPEKWLNRMRRRNFRIYVHAQNLLTITNYKGLDPETQSMSILPPLQTWTGGIQLGL